MEVGGELKLGNDVGAESGTPVGLFVDTTVSVDMPASISFSETTTPSLSFIFTIVALNVNVPVP